MTNNTDLLAKADAHRRLAGMHMLLARYMRRWAEGATPDELQTIWHEGFEAYGPAFADLCYSD